MERNNVKISYNTYISIIILFIVAILLGFSIFLIRTNLLQNTQNLGMALAHSYALEEELTLKKFTDYAELAYLYVDELDQNGSTPDEIQTWIKNYFIKLSELMGEGVLDAYAVIDGKIIAANPWEGDEEYPYWEKDWYQNAVNADRETIISNGYVDAVTDQTIFSISKELSRSGDVMAMDVYVFNSALHSAAQSLPAGATFYVCDQNGTVLYSKSQHSRDRADAQLMADRLLTGIQDGSLSQYDDFMIQPDGKQHGIYYYTMDQGWTVLMTLPVDSILLGDNSAVFYALGVIAIALFALLLTMAIRDVSKNRKMKESSDIIRMLGDSFFGVVRINFVTGTYEAIKMSKEIEALLPKTGDYNMLLSAVQSTVEPSTYQEFEMSFSLDSIRQRVKEGISDYGGDYQRHLGEGYRWVNIRTMYDPDTSPDEVIWCFRDVDVEKRQQLQHTIILKEALDAAKKSTKAKSQFFSNMSHDMRTPLNAIIGCTMLAQKAQQEQQYEKASTYIKKIEYAGNQLLSLINDILELSRMEAGKNALEEKTFNLKVFLAEVVDLFRDTIKNSQKTLEMKTEIKNQIVFGDEKKIGQILNNLLSNAVKYTNPGDSIKIEVRQFDFKRHSKFQIIVEDTGIGMSRNFLNHLFDPYTRETAFTTTTTVGTGLGMPIVKSLVQQLSGEISVDSSLGEGSRFTVTIPLKVVEDTKQTDMLSEEPKETYNWSGHRILLAEDNELNMEVASEILALHGVEVIPARNGVEAVQIFQAAAPYSIDLILMDMQMPEMDGCDATRAIRGLDKIDAQTVPIIAVTANAFAEDIDKTTKAGMNGHVSKPIDFAMLSQTAMQVMKRKV